MAKVLEHDEWMRNKQLSAGFLIYKIRILIMARCVSEGVFETWNVIKSLAQFLAHSHHCESESEVVQSCPTLCDPMECSLPGFSVHGIFQARVLEWVAISFSRWSSRPRDRTQIYCIIGRRFTLWATREAPVITRYVTEFISHFSFLQFQWFSFLNNLWKWS